MGNWIISWNYNKPAYAPGEQVAVNFWLENTGNTHLFLSELKLRFDFGSYDLRTISGMILPRQNKYMGTVLLQLPKNVVGRKLFSLEYRIYEHINDNWIDLGLKQSESQFWISVEPRPFYRVFVSRGLRPEGRAIGDPITEMIKEWGFDTFTVGIEIQVSEEQVPDAVKEQVKVADAVIAIATPRFLDALSGFWKTLEWHHDEVGIAFGIDKPLLILKERGVSLGGLPSYLAKLGKAPLIEFGRYTQDEIRSNLSALMPGFRDWIRDRRRQDFFDALGDLFIRSLAVFGTATIINGIVGKMSGTSKS